MVDALWEQTSALKAWGAMSRLMTEAQDEPDMRERAALAALINACVKKASGLSICPKDKSDPNAVVKSVRAPTAHSAQTAHLTSSSVLSFVCSFETWQKEKVSNQQKLSKQFAKHLPKLLEQCKTEPDQIEELAELPQYFDFDVYHTERLEKVPPDRQSLCGLWPSTIAYLPTHHLLLYRSTLACCSSSCTTST